MGLGRIGTRRIEIKAMKKTKDPIFLLEKRTERHQKRKKIRAKSDTEKKLPFQNRKIKYLCSISNRHANDKYSEKADFTVPRNFSLIENPDETLSFINQVAKTITLPHLKTIYFDHRDVINHDLGAELLLGFAASEVKLAAANRNREIRIVGHYPSSERKKQLIKALGVVKRLDLDGHRIDTGEESLEVFDFEGAPETVYRSGSEDRKNRCVRKFVEHINACVSHMGKKLTTAAVESLTTYMGEVIGNAEDHSGESRWYVYGYLDEGNHDEDTSEVHFCEIVIFNFGKTFSDTFTELDEESFSFKVAHPYVKAHEKKGFFNSRWTVEDLFTLVALQGNISSKLKDQNSDRGRGTVDLIEFFQNVAIECEKNGENLSRMSIISGKTTIFFDGKYRIEEKDGMEVIAFNNDNDLKQQPDRNYIKRLKQSTFPGALIAIRFPLESNKESLEDSVDNPPAEQDNGN